MIIERKTIKVVTMGGTIEKSLTLKVHLKGEKSEFWSICEPIEPTLANNFAYNHVRNTGSETYIRKIWRGL